MPLEPLPEPLDALTWENQELRRRLEEAEETLDAIRTGGVDALLVGEGDGRRVYTIETADKPYRLFIEEMQQGTATLQADGAIAWCNRQLGELLQIPRENLLGKSLYEFIAPASRAIFDHLLQQGQTGSGRQEALLQRADGSIVPVFLTFNALPVDSGVAIGVLITDLTSQRHHEELTAAHTALRESEQKLAFIAGNAPVLIAHCDTERRYKFVNERYAARFGLAPNDCIGKHIVDVVGTAAYQSFHHYVDNVLSGQPVEFEIEITYDALGTHFMRGSYAPEFGADGKVMGFIAAISDVSERRRAEEALRRSESNLRDFLENAAVGLHWVGPDGIIIWANQTEMDLLGYPRDEYIGRHIAEFHADGPVIQDILQRLTKGETVCDFEARLRCRDGSIRHVQINSNVLFENGQFIHTRCFTRDITEQKKAEEALRASEARALDLYRSSEAAKLRAEAATRAKDDFLAALSHELRTPLSPALLLTTELLTDPALPPAVRHDVEAISRGIALQIKLVDDLLDLTRITGGKLRLDLQPVDAHDALRQALELARSDIATRNIGVQLELRATQPFLHADAVRLQQVFWNVIKNAVKFTPPGGNVTVRTLHPADRQGTLIVEVTDSGIGIEPQMLDRIFDSFAQEQHGSVHRFGGLGLGLTITRRLVELQNGSITAHSGGRGLGATFRIEMPVSEHRPVAAALLPARSLPEMPPRRILLVEDHEMTRLTLTRLLERRGHTVFPSGTAAGGRVLAAGGNCDLVISDLGLPDCDGHTFMSEMRNTHGLPGIALSGYGAEEDHRRSRASGFFMHLTKPVPINALEAAIAAAPPPQASGANG